MSEMMRREFRVSLGFDFFPKKYTCDGEGVSPPIRLEGLSGRCWLALLMEDIDAHFDVVTHWVAWNVLLEGNMIPEGIPKKLITREPVRAMQGRNDFGKIGYSGPCPPRGETHRYRLTVYLLRDEIDTLIAGSPRSLVEKELRRYAIGFSDAVAAYGR
uniref:YbhB/YbcL family Raf kinase inhibitor-like protein n=1 Tax=Fervidicoccus fontis TaxID=683846 RepID=A0A7J3ZIM9_9CREN